MKIQFKNVLSALCIFTDLASSVWLPWYHEDFTANPQLEDDYIAEYGNEETFFEEEEEGKPWTAVRTYYNGSGLITLMRFCAAAHRQAGRGTVAVNAIKLDSRMLTFQNPFYESRKVDVLTYGVKNETDVTTDYWDLVVGTQNYMTEGIRPDCVCYLTLLSSLKMEFSLYQHVCDINVTGITDVVPERKRTTTRPTTERIEVTRKVTLKKATKSTKKKTTKKKSTTEASVSRKTRRKAISDTWT